MLSMGGAGEHPTVGSRKMLARRALGVLGTSAVRSHILMGGPSAFFEPLKLRKP